MFNMIITIISVVMIGVLAIASISYIGPAFTEGTAKANAATVVAQAQQIAAANTLYKNDNSGADATDVAALQSGGYLQASPVLPATVGATLALNGSNVEATITNSKVCHLINKQLDSAAADPLTTLGAKQYGCVTTGDEGSEVMTFQYKG